MRSRRALSPGPKMANSRRQSASASSPARHSSAWVLPPRSRGRYTSSLRRPSSPVRSWQWTAGARCFSDFLMTDPRKQNYEANKLAKRLRRQVGEAIADFNMIEEGDRVMVCLSGGKDSYGLLDVLLGLQTKAPVKFELIAVNLDQKQPGFPERVLPDYLAALGVPFKIVEQDTYSIVKRVVPEGKTMCALCSR